MAKAAAASDGINNNSDTATSSGFFQRLFIFGLLNKDMIRASRMSASAMPTVVVTERRRRGGAELARATRERAYISAFKNSLRHQLITTEFARLFDPAAQQGAEWMKRDGQIDQFVNEIEHVIVACYMNKFVTNCGSQQIRVAFAKQCFRQDDHGPEQAGSYRHRQRRRTGKL